MRNGLKIFALMTLLALLFTFGGSLAEQVFSHCGDDCCDSGLCEDCQLCLCCAPATLALTSAGVELPHSLPASAPLSEVLSVLADCRLESSDPPPRI